MEEITPAAALPMVAFGRSNWGCLKMLKYLSSPGRSNMLYLPLLRDTMMPILISEGEPSTFGLSAQN